MHETSHTTIEELLGAYALDAVDLRERDLIEQHLPGCPTCLREVDDHREVVALLSAVKRASAFPFRIDPDSSHAPAITQELHGGVPQSEDAPEVAWLEA